MNELENAIINFILLTFITILVFLTGYSLLLTSKHLSSKTAQKFVYRVAIAFLVYVGLRFISTIIDVSVHQDILYFSYFVNIGFWGVLAYLNFRNLHALQINNSVIETTLTGVLNEMKETRAELKDLPELRDLK